MKLIIATILCSFYLFSTSEWGTDFDKAKVEASQSHKYIILNFSGSDWCIPCIKLKKDIFESAAFQQYAQEHLVLIKADFPRLKKNQLSAKQTTQNEALADKYNPQGKFPYTLLIDANGKKLKEWDGYPTNLTIEEFIKEIQVKTNVTK
jgi:thioredoxin-related protein